MTLPTWAPWIVAAVAVAVSLTSSLDLSLSYVGLPLTPVEVSGGLAVMGLIGWVIWFIMRRRTSYSAPGKPPPAGVDWLPLKRKYVDKTHFLAQIMEAPDSVGKFIHAPAMRRIGKSTTIHMLAAMARGERHKFHGYAVNAADSPFQIGRQRFHVIQLDFSHVAKQGRSVGDVEGGFQTVLARCAREQHEIDVSGLECDGALVEWIIALQRRRRLPIVLLIDEYDAPVTEFLPDDPEMAQAVAQMMSPFYKTIKERGADFHKVFVTGVSKFSAMSMFSGANMFTPIMEENPEFCTLYGFTEAEIRATYGKYIVEHVSHDIDEVMTSLRDHYDGYRFHPRQSDEDLVYNPWSVLKFLETGQLEPYWATMGGPTSTTVEMLGVHGMDVLRGYNMTHRELFAPIAAKEQPKHWRQMAFQAGYATILESTRRRGRSTVYNLEMGPPNREVREWLGEEMSVYLAGSVDANLLARYAESLCALKFDRAFGDLEELLRRLPPLLFPRNEDQFGGYALHSLRHPELTGIDAVLTEVSQSLLGRARGERAKLFDGGVLVRTHDGRSVLLVVELKFQGSAEDALAQIQRSQYVERALAYLLEQHEVDVGRENTFCIGVNMSVGRDGTVALQNAVQQPRRRLRRRT